MMYAYITLNDGTEIIHSHVMDGNKVIVHFERPTQNGFDSARVQLPDFTWEFINGYSKEEKLIFDKLLENHQHLIYKYAREIGIKF